MSAITTLESYFGFTRLPFGRNIPPPSVGSASRAS